VYQKTLHTNLLDATCGTHARKQVREWTIVTKGVQATKDVAAELKALRKIKRDLNAQLAPQ
jgi:hypothetical protein